MRLDEHDAGRLVALVAANLHREYPSKIAHVLRGDGDVRPPRQLTPIFYGCFDWHSAVHSHWSLVRLVRLFPGARWARDVRARLGARPGFEMPYGIAWLLQLDAELAEARTDPELAGWRSTLAALVDLAGEQLAAWLARLAAPIRSGEHTQSAFAIGLALDWA